MIAEYLYLIIGGGMTGDAAASGIRHVDKTGSIGIITTESHPPYNRPPLSKSLWKGEPLETIWRSLPKNNVSLHVARTVTSIDRKQRVAIDNFGTRYIYKKLLLATGGSVRRLPDDPDGVIYFRTLDDYRRLKELTGESRRFAVIGGGFIGSEVAAALAMNGQSVTMLFPEDGIGTRVFPRALSQFLNTYFRSKGVNVLAGDGVTRVERTDAGFLVRTGENWTTTVDGVVAGLGITPNTGIAQAAGLKVDNGVIVDEFLRTSDPDIYAAGDVANFFSPALGKRVRVEHEHSALTTGAIAGRNMAGENVPYRRIPFFYSDLFDLGYEAVGELDSRMETVEEWKEPLRKGVVYYMSVGRVRGVLLWNTWGQADAARSLIAGKGSYTREDLRTLISA